MKDVARDAHHDTDAVIDRLRRSVRVKTINDAARVPRWIIRFGKAAKRRRRRR